MLVSAPGGVGRGRLLSFATVQYLTDQDQADRFFLMQATAKKNFSTLVKTLADARPGPDGKSAMYLKG